MDSILAQGVCEYLTGLIAYYNPDPLEFDEQAAILYDNVDSGLLPLDLLEKAGTTIYPTHQIIKGDRARWVENVTEYLSNLFDAAYSE